jgi:hypothetical protein
MLLWALAERMLRNVTPENDYDFLRADGSRDPRGICRMWRGGDVPLCVWGGSACPTDGGGRAAFPPAANGATVQVHCDIRSGDRHFLPDGSLAGRLLASPATGPAGTTDAVTGVTGNPAKE